MTDSVWLDLGYPARQDASGRLYKPLFAFMVIGLNGRIPLNTAGNLAAQVGGVVVPPSAAGNRRAARRRRMGGPTQCRLTWATRSARSTRPTPSERVRRNRPRHDALAAFASADDCASRSATGYHDAVPCSPNNTQVDNAGIDVRLTQLRNLLAGTRTPDRPRNGDTNGDITGRLLDGRAASKPYSCPTASPTASDRCFARSDRQHRPSLRRADHAAGAGRWGEAQSIPGAPFPTRSQRRTIRTLRST